jgi:hypothetical protein
VRNGIVTHVQMTGLAPQALYLAAIDVLRALA